METKFLLNTDTMQELFCLSSVCHFPFLGIETKKKLNLFRSNNNNDIVTKTSNCVLSKIYEEKNLELR